MTRDYEETLRFLFQLQARGMRFDLSVMSKLLTRLGNPHRGFPSVHVAGTNGKGSTCAMIASVLSRQGYRTGLYTSPHLIDFTERIQINSSPISRSDVSRLAEWIERELGPEREITPTFFDFTTALAFLFFVEQKIDIAVVEVGLGGRLDSTNVLNPLVSVITHVDLDHQEWLGTTLPQIGREKAGIIKKGIPAVSGVLNSEVKGEIRKIAESRGSRLFEIQRDFDAFSRPGDSLYQNRFDYRGIGASIRDLKIPLSGSHQIHNAANALAALEILEDAGFKQSERSRRDGLERVAWPGRLELLKRDFQIILDGAHNPSGAGSLAAFLNRLPVAGKKRLVLAMMKDKDHSGFTKRICTWPDEIILTRASVSRSAPPEILRSALPAGVKEVRVIDSISGVMADLAERCGKDDLVCLTGSLYAVGEAKAAMDGNRIDVPLHG